MAQLKAADSERFFKNPDFSKPVFLIYGPDAGLVSERATKLANLSGIDLSDAFSSVRISADDAAKDTQLLASEAHTLSMFGDKRLIRVTGMTRRDLARAVEPLLSVPPEDAIIIVEAGDLKKSAPLRKRIENSPNALAIPCYQDSGAMLQQLIDEEIDQTGLLIDRETKQELSNLLGEDRLASRNELKKLALYCHGTDRVEREDVRTVLADVSQNRTDTIIDAACSGNVTLCQETLKNALADAIPADLILGQFLRHVHNLLATRAVMEQEKLPTGQAVMKMRPPIHFSRKAQVEIALQNWNSDQLAKIAFKLQEAIYETRMRKGLENAITSKLLLATAVQSARASNN